MKLLFDQNLSPRLPARLAAEYPGSAHVRDFGLQAAPDPLVWAQALAGGFSVVSKDADFQKRVLLLGHPPKVIWLRTGNCTTAAGVNLLRSRESEVKRFGPDPTVSFLVLQ